MNALGRFYKIPMGYIVNTAPARASHLLPARRLVDSIGQGYTDLQQARLEAYLQVQGTLEPDQVRRLPLCPYLTANTWGDARAAGPYDSGRDEAAPEPPTVPAHQHQH